MAVFGRGAGAWRGVRQRPPRRRLSVDPRLLVGVVLVAASVAGVTWLVGTADRTVAVYSVRTALYPGDRIFAEDLAIARVRLGSGEARYLTVTDIPAEGAVISRPVGEGELLPAAAIGAPEGLSLAPLVIGLSGPLSEAASPGSTVDLWAA